ncbi:MAG: tRNA (adenosine(37)-N6)-threonylcarbamoyltransferase complex ATPase subunit type 1 TsaE [Dehalococcoidales bacterium]|nr:tRNA (adenosine(37)-N6)-threonylcarbamoyltransferase complex ATPase subunit type 1 TsaE [Dehalococcoidales bacterium]
MSRSPQATLAFGRKLGGLLGPGSIVALIGELGCGKTLLTRGICEGLGVPSWQVNSPTFVLVNEYQGRLPVYHLDLYRIGGETDGIELGITDYLARASGGIMIIEWAEKILNVLYGDVLRIHFEVCGEQERRLVLTADSTRYARLFEGIGRK